MLSPKKTPLYNMHMASGAKICEFAGWDMPLFYGSQIEEHHKVRTDAGMFDVSHMNVVDIVGAGARDYLRHLLANDVDKLTAPGKALYSCMLNENGGVVDDLIAYRLTNRDYRIVVNASTHDKDLAWFHKNADNFDVEIIEHPEFAMIAVQGPNAIAKAQSVFDEKKRAATKKLQPFEGVDVDGWWIARTGYTGEDGYEIMLPKEYAEIFWQQLLDAGVAPCGLIARDSLRLEAGMRLYGADMDDDVTPLEAGLGWSMAWEPQERDFIGRKAVEQQKAAGIRTKMVGLVFEGKGGVLRSHQKVIVEGIGEGETTSGGFSPTLGVSIALASVPKATGDSCLVEIRGKKVTVKIVKANFVRHGKKVY